MSLWRLCGVSLLVALTATTTPISAQTKDNPSSVWPGQSEAEFIVKDFRFHVGEVLTELRLHYVTLGAPHRNSSGDIDNAVLLLHTTGGDIAGLMQECGSFLRRELNGPLVLDESWSAAAIHRLLIYGVL